MSVFKQKFISLLVVVSLALTGVISTTTLTKAATEDITVLTIVVVNSTLDVIRVKAWPEKRVSKPGGNLDELLRTTFKNPDTGEQLLQTSFTSGILGIKEGVDISSLNSGTYHILVKGRSHLTKKLASLNITSNSTEVDLTVSETEYLLAGDVNGALYGDDIVNSIDLSILINDLDTFDLRTDLNRDTTVNALDLAILITNLDVQGDT
jgi:hypothetical protein